MKQFLRGFGDGIGLGCLAVIAFFLILKIFVWLLGGEEQGLL